MLQRRNQDYKTQKSQNALKESKSRGRFRNNIQTQQSLGIIKNDNQPSLDVIAPYTITKASSCYRSPDTRKLIVTQDNKTDDSKQNQLLEVHSQEQDQFITLTQLLKQRLINNNNNQQNNQYISFAQPMNINNKLNESTNSIIRKNYQKNCVMTRTTFRPSNSNQSRQFYPLQDLKSLELQIQQQNQLDVYKDPKVQEQMKSLKQKVFSQLKTVYINQNIVKQSSQYLIVFFDGVIGYLQNTFPIQQQKFYLRQGYELFFEKLQYQYNIIVVFSKQYSKKAIRAFKKHIQVNSRLICGFYKVSRHSQYQTHLYDIKQIQNDFKIRDFKQNTIILSSCKYEINADPNFMMNKDLSRSIEGLIISRKRKNIAPNVTLLIEDMRLQSNDDLQNQSVPLHYLCKTLILYKNILFQRNSNYQNIGIKSFHINHLKELKIEINLQKQIQQRKPVIERQNQQDQQNNSTEPLFIQALDDIKSRNAYTVQQINIYLALKKPLEPKHFESGRECDCCRYKNFQKPKQHEIINEIINQKYELNDDQKVLIFPNYMYKPQKNILIGEFERKYTIALQNTIISK